MKENEGEIRIELTSEKDDTISLIVSDNGSGFPSDVDFRATETFGLQLVIILVDQLDGSIKLKSNNNDNKLTEFKISFNERIEN